MGKKEIQIIHIPRWVTIALLIIVSAAMAFAIDSLSGHAYWRQPSLAEILSMIRRHGDRSPSSIAILATITPAMADFLFFVPWGALAFLAFYSAKRSWAFLYLVTIGVGVAFALALVGWQELLPTRVTAWQDVVWNAAGCAGGAALGHMRKRVRIRFE